MADTSPVALFSRAGVGCLLLLVGAIVAVHLGAGTSGAASSNVTVSATIASATSISNTNCATGQAGRTSFGSVLPGSSNVTTADCEIVFGSSNDSSMLKVYRVDSLAATAMSREWQAQASGTTSTIFDMHAFDANNVWGVYTSQLLKTTNGGATWTLQALSGSHREISVNGSTALVVGYGGSVQRSMDSGGTWATKGPATTTDFQSVHLRTASNAWIVGNKLSLGATGGVYVTSDAGAATPTWTNRTGAPGLPVDQDLTNVHAFSDTEAVVVGFNETIRRTIDGGANWTTPTVPAISGHLFDVDFVDASTGWAVGSGGAIVKTTDGGLTWTDYNAQVPGTTTMRTVEALSPTIVWIAGNDGSIMKSTDGGTTWTSSAADLAVGDNIESLTFANQATAWVASWNGRIRRQPGVAISDYENDGVGTDFDWAGGTSLFGACLRSVAGGASNDGTTWAADTTDADCADGDVDPWKPIAASAGASGSKVAQALSAGTTAQANIRFGFKTASNQQPGNYVAPLVYEVIAPNA